MSSMTKPKAQKIIRWTGWSLLALLLLALLIPYLLPRPGIDGGIPDQPFADSRFAQVEGIRLHYRARLRSANAGQALVVLVHGFGGSAFSWTDTLNALEDWGFDVIAVDLPPFGFSERHGGGPDWSTLVLSLARQVAPDRELVLVGHSMGAGVVAAAAGRGNGAVSQLVFVGGGPGQRRQRSAAWRGLLLVPSVGRALEVAAAHRLLEEESFGELLATALGREPTTEELAGYREPLRIPGTYPALLRRMSQGADSSGWQAIPAVAIWGEDDARVPLRVGQRLREQVPEMELLVIPGGSHNPMETQPEEFQALLSGILGVAVNPGPSAPESAKLPRPTE